MAQEFNPENYARVKSVVEGLESGAFSRLRPALETVKEQAAQSGSPDLIASCNGAVEGSESLCKLFGDLMDSLHIYLADNKKIYEALGYQV